MHVQIQRGMYTLLYYLFRNYFTSLFQSGGGKGKLVRSHAVCEESSPRFESDTDNQVSKTFLSCMNNFPFPVHDNSV